MKISQIGMDRMLRISAALIVVGLALEIVSLLWFRPLSFVLFAFVAASLIGVGILIYLISLAVFTAPSAEDRP